MSRKVVLYTDDDLETGSDADTHTPPDVPDDTDTDSDWQESTTSDSDME